MVSKGDIIEKSKELGFADIGFTTVKPFIEQVDLLNSRQEEYAWISEKGADLNEGIDPTHYLQTGKSIIVLIENYFSQDFPKSLENHFGRCYIDDDRETKDELYPRIKAFRAYLKDNGIDSHFAPYSPHRLAAARAGLGTFGKNCLFYSRKVALKGSWVSPIPLVVDRMFEPDEPTTEIGCPEWCKNACIIACPTGALKGPRKIDPRRCISYLSYYGTGPTPKELREPMGLWVYGCDRCQNVCPRNKPWLVKEKSLNKRALEKEKDFELSKLLHMDVEYFDSKIRPHMFYMKSDEIWRWKMNVARVMGNTLDPKYVPELVRAFEENLDDRVRCLIAWALGRIGGLDAKKALENFLKRTDDEVKQEIQNALNCISS
ncbi:MAG: epoxyqueuosine reductase [Candidatus Lokiarchaeota archaeon]|nr:epoxyqueuosine reductase [Candidatus Lokiarchaeota archaeon]